MSMTEPRTIAVDSLEVSFQIAGRADAPRLVLLHGFPLDRRMWTPALDRLGEQFHVYAFDLPGFGGSARIADSETMPMLADWLARVLPAAEIDSPIILCGLSMGGYIALEFAARHREWLSHLVLCDTKTAADTEEARAGRLALADSVGETGMEPVAATMLEKLVAPETLADNRPLVASVQKMMLDSDPASVAAVSRGMAARRDTSDVVAGLTIPLLSIVGESDSLTSPGMMDEFTRRARNGRLVVIPAAGHLSPMEQPKAFAAAVIEFVSRRR
ncbi:alpha/beta fold hydrolase [Candidatus Laterigemmans baculatus]|uniref:alpha/beta fold hydrolase n=1 Tax=Candidatus Laterigemmans baculatus TaxID=2770505 RepID=UPI0013DA683A|nr:alpha/beta fold hydrolase [Candidatus Laterigemmans baculatus]